MTLGIESVQVPHLLFTVEMQIIALVLITITCHEAVDMEGGEILADIETLHPHMLEVE